MIPWIAYCRLFLILEQGDMSAYCVSEEQLWSRKKRAPLRAWLLFLVQFLLHMFLSSLSSFLPPLLASCLHIRVPCSLPLKPPPLTSTPPAPPPTPLCSGDSPEQRSAAAWQRASPVPSLSGDHQWDLHPCTCAKLAGGLPQSHTRHYGVCVASPIHLYLFPTLIAVSLSSLCSSSPIMSRCSDSRPPLTLFEYVHAVISVSPNTDKFESFKTTYIFYLLASCLLVYNLKRNVANWNIKSWKYLRQIC